MPKSISFCNAFADVFCHIQFAKLIFFFDIETLFHVFFSYFMCAGNNLLKTTESSILHKNAKRYVPFS